MPEDPSAQDLIGRSADPRLLEADAKSLPSSVGAPTPLPVKPGRSSLVGLGVALGAITLVGGIGLAILGVVELLSGAALAGVVELWAGILLCATHWGWVHVAAWGSDKLDARQNHDVVSYRKQWLETIEPYARYEVATQVADDGSLTIETVCHRPVATDSEHFCFQRQELGSEIHLPHEPAAAIAERAELVRREAALRTAEAQQVYRAAADASHLAQLRGVDEREQMAAARAASQALSDQLNSRLREPPLVE